MSTAELSPASERISTQGSEDLGSGISDDGVTTATESEVRVTDASSGKVSAAVTF